MIKTKLKHQLSHMGLFPVLDLVRRIPEILGWLRSGCIGAAPPPVKRMVLKAYLKRYSLKTFFETGTYFGDTTAYIASCKAVRVTSIELDPSYYAMARDRFSSESNVTILNGDSGEVLPPLVRELDGPALFWLDGHYSGANTGKGGTDTPVSIELESILSSPVSGHVILIDDAHCFDGSQDYPYLEELLNTVRQKGMYDIEVTADIVRLTPRSTGA